MSHVQTDMFPSTDSAGNAVDMFPITDGWKDIHSVSQARGQKK